jgi:hypothetical protein
MYRQGDLLFKKVDSIPKFATQVNSNVILRGEATGHSHRIVNGQIFKDGFLRNGQMFIKAQQGAKVVHEEHATIELEIGFYLVIRQREFAPEGWLPVVD